MRLYFLRHADAVEGVDDAARPLSVRGEKQCRELGGFLKRAGIAFDAAWSSPLVRARQTAALVIESSHQRKGLKLQTAEALLNGTSLAAFELWLKELPEEGHVLLVGHAPSLAAHVRRLLGLTDETALALPKAGLACVETAGRKAGRLKWFVTPKALGF